MRVTVSVFMVKIPASEHLKSVTGRIFTITVASDFMHGSKQKFSSGFSSQKDS
jgi:hypothetical protein